MWQGAGVIKVKLFVCLSKGASCDCITNGMTPIVVCASINVLCALLHADRFLPSHLTAPEAPLTSWHCTVCMFCLGVRLSVITVYWVYHSADICSGEWCVVCSTDRCYWVTWLCVSNQQERNSTKRALPNGESPKGKMSPRWQATLCGHGSLKPRFLTLPPQLSCCWQTSLAISPFIKLQWSLWMSWGTTSNSCVTACSGTARQPLVTRKDP